MASHALDGHRIHWKPLVVDRERHAVRRKMREAFTIHRLSRKNWVINQDCGMEVSKIWLDLVNG